MNKIHTLDLKFQGMAHTIAAYLIPHRSGVVLVESGPGSTTNALSEHIQGMGLNLTDITDVLLTHIHLDHAGAAGWLAQQGARIHVHPVGAPHMKDPGKLLASAERIYGDLMQPLWGEFLPVPEENLHILEDGEVIEVGELCFRALDTPGHAEHHFAYIFEDTCFTGDIGGVRLPGPMHIRLPMPPPEFNLEKWRESLRLLQDEHARGAFTKIAPTHFGVYDNAGEHLRAAANALDEVERWMENEMKVAPPVEALNDAFLTWTRRRSEKEGITSELIHTYETANPSWMSSYGIHRYWKKHRMNG